MTVRIQAYITTKAYAYYPGQIIIDHPDEADWLARGQATPVGAPTTETATAPPPETAVLKVGRRKWQKSQ